MTHKKIYNYDFPEIREIGKQLKGLSGFVHTCMKGRYSLSTVRAVMNGRRNTAEIVAAMKHLVELTKAENY